MATHPNPIPSSPSTNTAISDSESHREYNTDKESGKNHTRPGPIRGCLQFILKKELCLVLWFGLTFICIAGSVLLVKLRDGKGNFTNKYFKPINPTAILNVISGVYSLCLAVALSNAIAISWWRDAARGTNTKKLSQIWDTSNIGILDLVQFRPKKYKKNYEAGVLALIAFVIAVTKTFSGPLLQQSLDVQTEDRFTNRTIKMDISKQIPPGWSGTIDASKPGNISFDPNFLSVIQAWYWGFPITTKPYEDYFCPGVCAGNVKAAGIVWNHSTSSESLILNDQYGNGSVAFATRFNRFENEWGIPTLSLLAKYVTSVNNSCGATVTIDTYNISMAVTEYPVIIHNDTITLNTTLLRESNSSLTPLKSDGDFVSKSDIGAGPLAALHGFGSEYFESNATINYNATTRQYDMVTKGVLAKLYYDTNNSDYSTHGLLCARQFKSPSEDILTALQKILFQVALQANNGSTTNFTVQLAAKTPIYHVKNSLLWSAFGLMSISVLILIFPIWGIIISPPDTPGRDEVPLIPDQHLRDFIDEDISMDPIRVAKAFYHSPVNEPGFRTGVVQYTSQRMVMRKPLVLPSSEDGQMVVRRR